MKSWRVNYCMLFLVICIWMAEGNELQNFFYQSSCPGVEDIVRQVVTAKFLQTPVTAQATLRLFFHDCFIQGCDASIMISSPSGDAEKDAPDNISLAGDGFDTVTRAKNAVEAICPGVVSCADILAVATRDVIALTGGPSFAVELGRRDGLRSMASDVPGNMPQPEFHLDQLMSLFANNGLDQKDMIALSGAHTIGVSHCSRIFNRLYNFSSSNPVDPALDPAYANQLMSECPQNAPPDVAIPIEPQTEATFDNLYYQILKEGKGLFTSDQELFNNPVSRETVLDFADNQEEFFSAFVNAITKLGRVGVKTGQEGEIRRDCSAFN